MSWISGYGCTTAAGEGAARLWASLRDGRDHSDWLETSSWPGVASRAVKAYSWAADNSVSQRKKLTAQILSSWREAEARLDSAARLRIRSGSLGVILASTKGFVDDFIWNADSSLESDALGPLLNDFIQSAELKSARRAVISNACASSLSALYLAEQWLSRTELTDVIVIAADTVGPFVVRGFDALRILTPEISRPFARDRSGFHLGEASAALVLSKENSGSGIYLSGVGVDAEGFAVTRPSQTGESLLRACLSMDELQTRPPNLIVAHGTGTIVNDQLEDHVYHELFKNAQVAPLITGTKWCVGHTLGACGAIDVVAAIKALETGDPFNLANTAQVDPSFKSNYAVSGFRDSVEIKRAMVCSLGFGGIHATALIERREG